MPESIEDLRRRARLRERMLVQAFADLVEEWPEKDRGSCFLNRQIALGASEAYFKDIERKKAFHGIDKIDAHKRAAYWLKWLMQFRPIQIHEEPDCSVQVLLANEHFAMAVATGYLRMDLSRMKASVYKHMIYSLRYRKVDANSWALSFCLMEEAYGTPGSPAPVNIDIAGVPG